MTMVRASRHVQRKRQGRQTANSNKEASPVRSAVAPEAPTAGNSPLASAAPAWKHSIATSNMATDTAIEGCRCAFEELTMLKSPYVGAGYHRAGGRTYRPQ